MCGLTPRSAPVAELYVFHSFATSISFYYLYHENVWHVMNILNSRLSHIMKKHIHAELFIEWFLMLKWLETNHQDSS